MMLEQTDRIDVIAKTPDGKLLFVITDAGLTPDPEERFRLLLAKLSTYVGYIMGDDFSREHPDKAPSDVAIQIMCARPSHATNAGSHPNQSVRSPRPDHSGVLQIFRTRLSSVMMPCRKPLVGWRVELDSLEYRRLDMAAYFVGLDVHLPPCTKRMPQPVRHFGSVVEP